MNYRNQQAANDGAAAFGAGKSIESCTRRAPDQRRRWRAGWEAQRRIARAAAIPQTDLDASSAIFADLKSQLADL